MPKKKDLSYFRGIPCNGDLLKVYWINYYYNQNMLETKKKQGLLGAFLLKWLKEGRVTICKNKNGEFNINSKKYAIDLSKMEPTDSKRENELVSILLEASGDNEILEPNEFKKWCSNNYKILNNWFKSVLNDVVGQFIQDGMITIEYENLKYFNTSWKAQKNIVNSSMKDLAIELYGFKKYLLDYSLIHERNAQEVELWEDYLIYAQLLGIANKVQNQFKKLYPNFNEVSNINLNYSNIIIDNFANSGLKSARRSESYDSFKSSGGFSSGDGGSSFDGGGDSSSGHSSGGGFR